jgi:hypothetical protein
MFPINTAVQYKKANTAPAPILSPPLLSGMLLMLPFVMPLYSKLSQQSTQNVAFVDICALAQLGGK